MGGAAANPQPPDDSPGFDARPRRVRVLLPLPLGEAYDYLAPPETALAPGALVEVPLGIRLGDVVNEVGGGRPGRGGLKAVRPGGGTGGTIPAEKLDLPVDYENLTRAGSIMGSGGMVVMDESTCMVDVAKFFLDFTRKESCGKCTFCRIGTKRMLEILDRITRGEGEQGENFTQ